MPSPSTDQLSTVTYVSGLNADGTIAATSFNDWNDNTPATYTATKGFAHKWDDTAAGVTAAATSAAGTGGGTVTYGFNPASNVTAAQQAAFVATLTLWSDECNITFAPASSAGTADLLLTLGSGTGTNNQTAPQQYSVAGSARVPSSLTPTDGGGQDVITFDTSGGFGALGSFTALGGYGIDSLVHEMGHMLGLGHSGPYDDGATQADTVQQNEFDSRQWSVMSYIQPDDPSARYYSSYTVTGTDWANSVTTATPGGGTSTTTTEIAPSTPMALDILAVQRLYGAPVTTGLSGGQIFGFNCNITDAAKPFFDFTQDVTPVVTLYDKGTGNTLDLSGYATACTVNLNPGSFSSAGALTNNIGIAFGTAIDSAVGGSGNDSFTVNADADTITGGGGTDTVIFGAARSAYILAGTRTTYTVTQTATGITDTLHAIANLQFTDQTVVTPLACFRDGTRLLTARGEVAVEALRLGDLIACAAGRLAPVRWIGRSTVDAARDPELRPVRVRAGAFADGMPHRDLLLSPDHAVFADGALIPVRWLVNDRIVLREAAGTVAYWHVELDRHAVLLAEGLPAESYLDTGNRHAFDSATCTALRPDPTTRDRDAWATRACAPLVEHGPRLDRVQARLARRAQALGLPPEPAIDIRIAAPGRLVAELPPGTRRVHLRSACAVPANDSRRLGAALAALALDDTPLTLTDTRLASGFHRSERDGPRTWRWSDGCGVLQLPPCDRSRRLTVDVAQVGGGR